MQRDNLFCLIDWLQFTIPYVKDLQIAYDMLGIPKEEFNDMPRGLHGYAKQKSCGNIRILYEAGRDEMGIHVQLSGQGCREYESYYNEFGWMMLLERIINGISPDPELGAIKGRLTRLDVAVDEIRYNGDKPYWTVTQLIRKVKRDECKSKFKKAKRIEDMTIAGGKSNGQTVYFGSVQSDIKIRVYEKDQERENAGKEVDEAISTWNRLEIELNDERAQMAAYLLLSGKPTGSLIFGILEHYMDFLDRVKDDTNKSRWPRTKFWDLFLQDAQKVQLTNKPPDATIPRKQNWMMKQVLPTMAEVWWAVGSPGADHFVDMLEQGMERMTDAQWQRAQEYRDLLEKEAALLRERKTKIHQEYQEVQHAAAEQWRGEQQYKLWEKEHRKKPSANGSLEDPLA